MNDFESISAYLFIKAGAPLKTCDEILDRLGKLQPLLEIVIVTYGKALDYFKREHPKVLSLPVPENPDFLQLITHSYQLISDSAPQLVIAYDEYPAVAAANMADIPAIIVTNWIPPEQTLQAEALTKASSVILLEEHGIYPIPSRAPEIIYCGPAGGKTMHFSEQRQSLRRKLGIEEEATVMAVTQGALLNGNRPNYATIVDVIISSYLLLDFEPKHLIINQEDAQTILKHSINSIKNVCFVSTPESFNDYVASSNLLIANGSRESLLEAKNIGIPSISLVHNPGTLDFILGSRIRSNLMLNAQAVTADSLAVFIKQILDTNSTPESIRNGYPETNGAHVAAETIISEARRLTYKSYDER